MRRFVLDNSVAMRWLLASIKPDDQAYAESVLASLTEAEAVVPDLWHLEAANVLLSAEKRSELSAGEVEQFIAQLENLPIAVDPRTANQVFSRALGLARAYMLSSYDAAYLELALREKLPLASLDKDLIKAAVSAGVSNYLDPI
jgi:predicted nucleic acid-binding protein